MIVKHRRFPRSKTLVQIKSHLLRNKTTGVAFAVSIKKITLGKLDRVALLITDPPPTSSTTLSKKTKAKCYMGHLTPGAWHVTSDTCHVIHDMWYLICDTWHVKNGGSWTFSQNFRSLACCGLAVKVFFFFLSKWAMEQINQWQKYL